MKKYRTRSGALLICYELRFTTRERYCRAVRYLMASEKYCLFARGRSPCNEWYVNFYRV